MAQTVNVPDKAAAGAALAPVAWLPAGAWLVAASGAVLPLFVPQLASRRPMMTTMAVNRKGRSRARLVAREVDRG
jgi:hypothetical protein